MAAHRTRRRAAAGLLVAVLAGGVTAGCSAVPLPGTTTDANPTPSPTTTRPLTLPAWQPRVTERPNGPDIVRYESLQNRSTLTATLAQAPYGEQVALLPGDYTFRDFSWEGNGTLDGVTLRASLGGVRGSGVGRTVFSMVPLSSTRKSDVPTRDGTTNQLSLMRAGGDGTTLTGFTLEATPQGHVYNGLRIQDATALRVSDVRVVGVPGNDSIPPGETFGINDYRTSGSVYSHVEVDGAGVGASGFGANNSTDVTIEHSYFHGERHSMGATFWQTRDVTITDSIGSDNGWAGFNFERVSGAVRLARCVTSGNGHGDIRIASDRGSAKYTIVDPVFTGPYFTIVYPARYLGHANAQQKSDIRLIVHGKDRTADLVRYVSQ